MSAPTLLGTDGVHVDPNANVFLHSLEIRSMSTHYTEQLHNKCRPFKMDCRNIFELMQQELGDDRSGVSDEGSDDADYQPSSPSESSEIESVNEEDISSSSEPDQPNEQATDRYISRDGRQWFKDPLPAARTPQRNLLRQLGK